MAQMYAAVEKGILHADFDPARRDHEISVTLARVLFLLFGDDTEMWTSPEGEPLPDLFQNFVEDHTQHDGSDIAARINALFTALDTSPTEKANLRGELAVFPYVNGGLFAERITLPDLDDEFRNTILTASAVNWSTNHVPPSSARCSSPSVTPRPVANSGSTTPPRRTSSRPSILSSSMSYGLSSSTSRSLASTRPTGSGSSAINSAASATWTLPAAAATSSSSPTGNCGTSNWHHGTPPARSPATGHALGQRRSQSRP